MPIKSYFKERRMSPVYSYVSKNLTVGLSYTIVAVFTDTGKNMGA